MLFRLIPTIVLSIFLSSDAVTHFGREFILVFIEQVVNQSKLKLLLSTESTSTVNVKVSAPLEPSTQPILTDTVTKGQTTTITLEMGINIIYSDIYNRGVRVVSDEDIVVQGFSISQGDVYKTAGAFLAFPVTAFGTSYMVISNCQTNSCQLGVVSSVDGTEVSIHLKIQGGNSIRLSGTNYYTGDTITLTLNRYQALHVQCSGDLSGTKVSGTEPIGVFVGTDYTRIGSGSSEDMLFEQLLPVHVWGMDYVLFPFPDRTAGDVIKVVAEFTDTTVTFQGTDNVISDAGDSLTFTLPSSSPAILTSNKRLLVAQTAQSPVGGETSVTDPAMILVAPMAQWLDSYIFSSHIFSSDFTSVKMAIVTDIACQDNVYIDGVQTTSTWGDFDGAYAVSYVTVDDGAHLLNVSSSCGGVWAFLYGPGSQRAWAMPIGWNLLTLPEMKTTISTSTTATTTTTTTTTTPTSTTTTTTTTTPTTTTTTPTTTTSTSTTTTSTTTTTTTITSTSTTSTTTTIPTTSTSRISTTTTTTTTTPTSPTTSTASSTTTPTTTKTTTPLTTATKATTTLTSTTRQTTASNVKIKTVCSCKCIGAYNHTLEQQITIVTTQIKKNLTLEKMTLSSSVRSKTSALDNRPSSVAIGSTGVIMVSFVIVVMSVSDLISAISYFCKRC